MLRKEFIATELSLYAEKRLTYTINRLAISYQVLLKHTRNHQWNTRVTTHYYQMAASANTHYGNCATFSLAKYICAVAIDIITTKANYIVTMLTSHSSTWCKDGFTTLQILLQSVTMSAATSVHSPLNTEHKNSDRCIYMAAISIESCIYFDECVFTTYKTTETLERLQRHFVERLYKPEIIDYRAALLETTRN